MLKRIWNFLFKPKQVDVSALTKVINTETEIVVPNITKTHEELASIVNERIKELENKSVVTETTQQVPTETTEQAKPKKKKYYNNKKKKAE